MKRWFDLVGAGFLGAMIFCIIFPKFLNLLIRSEFLFLATALFFGRGFTRAPLSLLYFSIASAYVLIGLNSPILPGVVKADFYHIIFSGGLGVVLAVDRMRPQELAQFILNLNRFVACAAVVGAVLGLVKLVALTRGIELGYALVSEAGVYPPGSSLHNDYNLFALALTYGAVACLWLPKNEHLPQMQSMVDIGLPLLVAATLTSTSRRGAICVVFLSVIYFYRAIINKRAAAGHQQSSFSRGVWIFLFLGYLYYKRSDIALFWNEFLGSFEFQNLSFRMQTVGTAELFVSRLTYWDRAWELVDHFSLGDYVLGTGFDYVWTMGDISGNEQDYPHNIFLSALLYGGILQLGLTLVMLATALKKTFSGGNLTFSLFYWMLIDVIFLFFSSNSVFSSLLLSALILIALTINTQKSEKMALPQSPALSEPRGRA